MRQLTITSLVLALSASSLFSQTKLIQGKVISDHFDILNVVFITIDDTVKIGKTDLNGSFHIEIPDSVQELSFKGPGLEPIVIDLLKNCEVEVIMLLIGSDDYMSLKKSDRFRKKRLKKLPGLHRKAFEKGIFKTDKPCYKIKQQ